MEYCLSVHCDAAQWVRRRTRPKDGRDGPPLQPEERMKIRLPTGQQKLTAGLGRSRRGRNFETGGRLQWIAFCSWIIARSPPSRRGWRFCSCWASLTPTGQSSSDDGSIFSVTTRVLTVHREQNYLSFIRQTESPAYGRSCPAGKGLLYRITCNSVVKLIQVLHALSREESPAELLKKCNFSQPIRDRLSDFKL
jgi:hypothetical protein